MGNIIFDDLEIDYSNMMKDPESFSKAVEEAANELKRILRASNSIENYIRNLPKDQTDLSSFQKELDEIWTFAEANLSVGAYPKLSDMLRKMANDIDYLAKSKAANEMANSMGAVDKQTAHFQYTRLREAYNKYAGAMSTLNIAELVSLPSMPGNYGPTVGLVHYLFQFEGDDEVYRNPYAVCKRLGIEGKTLMDLIEYLSSHNTTVTVKQVTN